MKRSEETLWELYYTYFSIAEAHIAVNVSFSRRYSDTRSENYEEKINLILV